MDSHPSAAEIHAHHHAVKFYGSDESLFATVGSFLSEGPVAGQPAVLIATPAHRDGIVDELRPRLIDVDRARDSGCLVVLDADKTLASIMAGTEPDAGLFEREVGGVIVEPETNVVRFATPRARSA